MSFYRNHAMVLIVGLAIAIHSANAIAYHIGSGANAWLLAAFALGVILISQASVLRLRAGLADVQRKLSAMSGQRT